jgi:anti-sigma regulatory factor (Ser/Thr protein kinase)
MTPRTFEIHMDSNVQDVTLASAAVRAFLSRLNLEEHQADMTELCLQEALVNCVSHSYGRESGKIVRLRMHLGEETITFEVEDQGTGTTREELEKAIQKATVFDPQNPSTLSHGGRGMLIISQVMDSWDYIHRDGWNVLRMTKTFDSAPS